METVRLRCVLFFLLVSCAVIGQAKAKNSRNATKVLLYEEAQKMNAVCLDGSPPGYYINTGTGEGGNKWIVHLMGGGWCSAGPESCYNRSLTLYGSTGTKYWADSVHFDGFLSDDPNINPDFHDWNMVFVIYCDGGSFAGNRDQPDLVYGHKLYYRGYRILKAVINHLNMEKGMNYATDIILTGCSAGGLAVYMHADFVKTMISPTAKYRAFADAGYFLDMPNINGSTGFAESFMWLMNYQVISDALLPTCRAQHTATELWKCMFAPHIYNLIKTPLFVLNSMYDTAQLNSIYGLPCLPGNCTAEEMKDFEHFKDVFDQQIQPVLSSSTSNGYFFDSCLVHCQTVLTDDPWTKYAAMGHPMRESFADWYYERPSSKGATRVQDCDYPCNPTCP